MLTMKVVRFGAALLLCSLAACSGGGGGKKAKPVNLQFDAATYAIAETAGSVTITGL